MASDDEGFDLDSVFTETPRPPTPQPTISTYTREGTNGIGKDSWKQIDIRLVGSHPLWAHYLWNAALALATFFDTNEELYRARCVLELGAGGALPSIVAAKNGARKVVITDYPDASLVDNIRYNVDANTNEEEQSRVKVHGYIWGQDVKPLLGALPSPNTKFDLIILSDLIFNHSQHDALLTTCEHTLAGSASSPRSDGTAPSAPEPCVLVFYSHHRPHLAHRDMEFFTKATERGWVCEEVLTRKFPAMFPEDSGDESVRSTTPPTNSKRLLSLLLNFEAMDTAMENSPSLAGAPFLGFTVGCILFGCTLLQAYQYFMSYMHDNRSRKLVVCYPFQDSIMHGWRLTGNNAILLISLLQSEDISGLVKSLRTFVVLHNIIDMLHSFLDASHLVLSTIMIYLSISAPKNHADPGLLWTLKARSGKQRVQHSLTILVLGNGNLQGHSHSLSAKLLSTHHMDPGEFDRKPRDLPDNEDVMPGTFVAGIGYSHIKEANTISDFSASFQRMVYVACASQAMIDTSIAVLLSYLIIKTSPPRNQRLRTRGVVHFFVLFFVGTGVLTAICAVAVMTVIVTNPSTVLYLTIEFSFTRLYANSILAMFNSKARLRQQMEATSELKLSSRLIFGDELDITTQAEGCPEARAVLHPGP
ncbi:hypothetical protein D9619_013108 [Psilocybe cf. subviscida]|uniref:DUF6534 domain-containing protein n=1 Tax=Psilocybe cf. subviscida TaxID=2480587 RepID=A0A8H5B1C1_9AGAR|nr:hypothetical protein D9619_013108 [Psilocybe cf. subviscida]